MLSSHSSLRSQCVPAREPEATAQKAEGAERTITLSHYISWSELLRRTFQIEAICARCQTPLRLSSVIKTEETPNKILSAMGLPTEAPEPWPARAPPTESGEDGGNLLN